MNHMSCGLETDDCCFDYIELTLIEVIYLNNKINKILKSDVRSEVIRNAVGVFKKIGKIRRLLDKDGDDPGADKQNLIETYNQKKILCPLNRGGKCCLYEYRPIQCRLYDVSENMIDLASVHVMLFNISKNVFFAFSGSFLEKDSLSFSLAETVSGKFVQEYFHYLAYLATAPNN
jgi:Fe-S-cluster containining protein